MRIIRRAAVAAIGAVALAGALALPATASAAVTSQPGGANQEIHGHYRIYDYTGTDGIYATGLGNVLLGPSPDVMETIAVQVHGGHDYYQWKDTQFHNVSYCLQANTADTYMALGTCVNNNQRQFWWYDNSSLLKNLAFSSFAFESGNHVKLNITSGGSPYVWIERAA